MMRLAQLSLKQRNGARTAVGGFTLIEILVVVAMLAIIKIGAIFLPFDHHFWGYSFMVDEGSVVRTSKNTAEELSSKMIRTQGTL